MTLGMIARGCKEQTTRQTGKKGIVYREKETVCENILTQK